MGEWMDRRGEELREESSEGEEQRGPGSKMERKNYKLVGKIRRR